MGLQEYRKKKRRIRKIGISLLIFFISFCQFACKEKGQSTVTTQRYYAAPAMVPVSESSQAAKEKLYGKKLYWVDSLLHNNDIDTRLIRKYINANCPVNESWASGSMKNFEGFNELGYIRHNKKKVKVFVLPPITYCEEGQAYYFSDPSLPRLPEDFYCCHPGNIFVTDDIDEDGINEIVEFYSTCEKKINALKVWSLKKNAWKEVGAVTYDPNYAEIPIEKRIRKTRKGHFQLLLLTAESVGVFGEKGKWLDLSTK